MQGSILLIAFLPRTKVGKILSIVTAQIQLRYHAYLILLVELVYFSYFKIVLLLITENKIWNKIRNR